MAEQLQTDRRMKDIHTNWQRKKGIPGEISALELKKRIKRYWSRQKRTTRSESWIQGHKPIEKEPVNLFSTFLKFVISPKVLSVGNTSHFCYRTFT